MHEADYVAVGRIAGSIDQKAEAVLKALTEKNPMDRTTLERVMKALTDLDERNRATRRPQKLSELRALVTDSLGEDPEVAEASLSRALDTLKTEDTSFLQFGEGDDPEIDIGHEALIRSWKRLAGSKPDFAEGWLREERVDSEKWRDYARHVGEGRQFTWTEQGDLPKWLREHSLGEIWSQRYGNQWRELAELRVRSRRSTAFKVVGVACGWIVLLLGVGWFARDYYAGRSAHTARLNALSLAGQGRAAARDGDSRLAVLLALDGVKDDQNLPQPESALFDALARPIEAARLSLDSTALSATFSPDGRLIAAVSKDRKLHVWNADTFQPIHLDESLLVQSASFSPDARLIAAVSSDRKLRVWSTETLKPVHLDETSTKDIASATFAPDISGNILVGSYTRKKLSLRLWNAETGRPIGDSFSPSPCELDSRFLVEWQPDRRRRLFQTS